MLELHKDDGVKFVDPESKLLPRLEADGWKPKKEAKKEKKKEEKEGDK